MPGMGELIVILLIVLVVFGANKLPGIGDALGRSIKNFKKASSNDDKEIDRVYYWVGEGTVDILAFDKEKPLLSTYSVLKNPAVSDKWSYKGETYMQGTLADLKMDGRSKKISQIEFEGKKIDAIEVRLEATILEEFGTKITVTQVATYGRGVGLVKMESTSKLPRRTVKSTRKLTAYKPARS